MTDRFATDPGPGDSTCRVAVDLVRVGDVERSIFRFGDRYLRRVYTDHELWTCSSVPGAATPDAGTGPGLATRFAAKAATLDVLEASGVRGDLRSIEVLHHPEGACGISLNGDVAAEAADAGIRRIGVSVSHGGGTASAVVTAICSQATASPGRAHPSRPTPGGGARGLDDRIRSLLDDHARLRDDVVMIGEDDDLYRSGLTSHASVDVLLALEEEFGVTFPVPMAERGTFRSIAAIRDAVRAAAYG